MIINVLIIVHYRFMHILTGINTITDIDPASLFRGINIIKSLLPTDG